MNALMRPASIACAVVCLALIAASSPMTSAAEGAVDHRHDHGHSHEHDHSAHGESDVGGSNNPSAFGHWGLLGLYSLLIVSASLFGGWLPGHVKLSHLQFQMVMSGIGGLILGIGVLHLLPHALHETGFAGLDAVTKWTLFGMIMMFFLLRAFHVHHHPSDEQEASGEDAPNQHSSHSHAEESHRNHSHALQTGLSWMGIFFGLAVHTLLDGLALGATMQAEAHASAARFIGIGVLLAIALHKPLDSLSFTTLMINAEQSRGRRLLANLVYASLCPIGAAIFLLGVGQLDQDGHFVVGCSLAFSAGVFICIALADLLPEMEFHSHHRVRLSVALLMGIALAWGIQFLEPEHLHH